MQWNLAQIFKTEKDLKNFINQAKKQAKNFNQIYKDNLVNLSADAFAKAFKEYEKIQANISKILTYSYLKFAKDVSNGSELAKIEQICNEISEDILFFELEFNQLDEKTQDIFIKAGPTYSYYLTLIQKQKTHQLSFLEERVLLKSSPTSAQAFVRLFDETMTRIKFNYDDKELSQEQILSLLHDKDRDTRKKAAISISSALEANSHLLTYIYNMIKTDLKISCKLRNYPFAESSMHEANQIEKQSVDALILACESSFDIVGKFYDKKREILGYDALYDYDRYAPIGDDANMSFNESKDIILCAFGEFSPLFLKLAQRAFDEGWIDAYPYENKQSGAFSHFGSSDTHPFVLLNHTDKRRDLFTMAHELGHAIHQYLSYNVSFLNSFMPLTTAETASVFCEMVVFSYMKSHADDKSKRAMLAGKLEDIFATLYRQINFTTFERAIHAHKDELKNEQICEIWMNESKKMFDGKLILNDYYKSWWSYIPHFVHTPFYCYAYGYAQLLVLALFGLYKSRKCENFAQIYTEFLSLGGSMSPKDMVAKFDLDINSSEFWQIGLDEIRKLVDEFIKL